MQIARGDRPQHHRTPVRAVAVSIQSQDVSRLGSPLPPLVTVNCESKVTKREDIEGWEMESASLVIETRGENCSGNAGAFFFDKLQVTGQPVPTPSRHWRNSSSMTALQFRRVRHKHCCYAIAPKPPRGPLLAGGGSWRPQSLARLIQRLVEQGTR
jgi:hypothetical protein